MLCIQFILLEFRFPHLLNPIPQLLHCGFIEELSEYLLLDFLGHWLGHHSFELFQDSFLRHWFREFGLHEFLNDSIDGRLGVLLELFKTFFTLVFQDLRKDGDSWILMQEVCQRIDQIGYMTDG